MRLQCSCLCLAAIHVSLVVAVVTHTHRAGAALRVCIRMYTHHITCLKSGYWGLYFIKHVYNQQWKEKGTYKREGNYCGQVIKTTEKSQEGIERNMDCCGTGKGGQNGIK